MPATIRSAIPLVPMDDDDLDEFGNNQLKIQITQYNFQQKLHQMQEDRNDADTVSEFSSYSTKLSIDFTTEIPPDHVLLGTLISSALGNVVDLDLRMPATMLFFLGFSGPGRGRGNGDGDGAGNTLGNEISKLVHLQGFHLTIANHRGQRLLTAVEKENLRLMGEALAQLPQLKKVYLHDIPHCWYLPEMIQPLLERQPNPVLSCLYASSAPITLQNMFAATTTNHQEQQQLIPQEFLLACSCMKELTLKMSMQQSYITALGEAIRKSTSLTSMDLTGEIGDDDTISLVPLAEGLQYNTSLRYLSVSRGGPTPWQRRRRLERQQQQEQQQRRDVPRGRAGPPQPITPNEAETFANVLAHRNYTLERLELQILPQLAFHHRSNMNHNNTEVHNSNMKKMDFYVSLNKAGRAKLMGIPPFQQQHTQQQSNTIAPLEEWVRALAQKDSISVPVIYYFLQANLPMFSFYTPKDSSINIDNDENGASTPPKQKRQRRW